MLKSIYQCKWMHRIWMLWQMKYQSYWTTILCMHGCMKECLFCYAPCDRFSPSWHSDVVTTLSQRRCWRCHNVVARSKMWVVPTSVSDVVTTSLSNVVKTLPQRCYNVATTLSIGLVLGHFTMDYSDFFPFTETWKLQKC